MMTQFTKRPYATLAKVAHVSEDLISACAAELTCHYQEYWPVTNVKGSAREAANSLEMAQNNIQPSLH